ncbi:MAG: hypothetical protein NTV49_05205 [Kiritimatiellaeota bacterium]|nr:hypothetical protein [Kiritimatiellota bacterium]
MKTESSNAARTAAGFKAGDWPHNAARHTYASHALTKQQDAAKVALQLGHTTTHLLFDHYRGLVTPQEAERYFNIRPPAEANIIRFPALSA